MYIYVSKIVLIVLGIYNHACYPDTSNKNDFIIRYNYVHGF